MFELVCDWGSICYSRQYHQGRLGIFYGQGTRSIFLSGTSHLRREGDVQGKSWTSQAGKQVVPGAQPGARRGAAVDAGTQDGDSHPRSWLPTCVSVRLSNYASPH